MKPRTPQIQKSGYIQKVLVNSARALPVLVTIVGLGVYIEYFGIKAKTVTPASTPATEVHVETLKASNLRLWSSYSGRLHAVDSADVRPEVSGRIVEVRFQDGQIVKEGDVLFVIDPRPFQDTVDRNKAAVTSAKARLVLAQLQQKRLTGLLTEHAVSQDEVDIANSQLNVAEADVETSEAALKQSQVDLEHAYVTAPISGRTSRAEITVGNVVQSGTSAPVLTSIISQDSIYADFDVDEQTYLKTIRATANNPTAEKEVPVKLVVSGDTDHVYDGFIQNFDNQIDTASGTIRARAKFTNDDKALAPGMFVTVRLASSTSQRVVLVPEQSISFDQSKKFVLVVDSSNHVVYREVSLGNQVGSSRIAEQGVQAGDRVIVDGVQRVHPGDEVVAQEVVPEPKVAANK